MQKFNFKKNIDLINFDSISRYNLFHFNNIIKVDKLYIKVILNTVDNNFLKSYYILSKIFKNLFNRKIHIFNIKKVFIRGKGFRNSLVYSLGITLRKELIFKNIDYLFNCIIPLSKKIDNNIRFKSSKDYRSCSISFSNLNYLLGLDSYNYYNLSLEFNYIIKLKKNNSFKLKNNNNLYKFYAQIFTKNF
jgi:hypothetical protein